MRLLSTYVCLFALALGSAPALHAADAAPMRERIRFNDAWRFQKGDPADAGDSLSYGKNREAILASASGFVTWQPAPFPLPPSSGGSVSYLQPDFDDSHWRQVQLPHDWGIEGPFDQNIPGETGKLPCFGIGWYRKSFEVTATDQGKQTFLQIDGAMSYSSVWLNGALVGGWPYGYASYQLDLTPYLHPGRNTLAIRLDNPNESSRWYPGSGLYRNVWLVKTPRLHLANGSVAIATPQVSSSAALVTIIGRIANLGDQPPTLTVALHTVDPTGTTSPDPVAITTLPRDWKPSADGAFTVQLSVANPRLWDLEKTHRYLARITLLKDQTPIDQSDTLFGIRTVAFTTDNGFLLNGHRVPIRGVCMHHDLGALGSAFNLRAAERQIELLKETGVNAIRCAHNPPAPELLDLCDRMGILVMDEFVDTWKAKKVKNGYQNIFDDWSEKDVRAMVRRDRNHPSVILWSVGNEIPEQSRKEGPAMQQRLAAFVHEEDPTRSVTMAISDGKSGYNGFQNHLDVFGYNYKPHEYKKFREKNPTIPLVGSETASVLSSRGEYVFPVVPERTGGKSGDFQMSSYDLYHEGWATRVEAEFAGQDGNPFVAGEFVWTGFDYLGEPTPFNADITNLLNYHTPEAKAKAAEELKTLGKIRVPSRSSYFGIFDLAGFKKDRFYLYQSRWRPDLRIAHILPHWNWPERVGQITPVHVYTSGDAAELFLNGQSLGRRTKKPGDYRLVWDDVKYAPGTLTVTTYKAGQQWATATVSTTGPAAKLTLKPDRAIITNDGLDLSFITVSVVDKADEVVPRSKPVVNVSITGPGELVAIDNGDPTDQTIFSSAQRKAFNGLALIIVRAKPGATGAITVQVQSDGLTTATTTVDSQAPGTAR